MAENGGRLMRVLATSLFVLALAKVGLVHHLHQAASRDVIVAAFGNQARAACAQAEPLFNAEPAERAPIEMIVGDRERAVNLWQVDHADWASRFRQVFLVLKHTQGSCRYDIRRDTAFVWGKGT
jgi:hypothetical protein